MARALKHLDQDGATQIFGRSWPDGFAGINQVARKFGVENIGDSDLTGFFWEKEQIGDNDGWDQIRMAVDTTTAGAPHGLQIALSAPGAGGVWGTTRTVYYRITTTNAIGESVGSIEIAIDVDDVTKKVTLTWLKPTGATGYKVYRSDAQGVYTPTALRGTISSGDTLVSVDDGSAPSTGSLPSVNSTADWVVTAALGATGTGGTWSGTGIRYWQVNALDSTGTIIAASREVSVNVDDITKKVTLTWSAVTGATTYKVFRTTVQSTYTDPALVAAGTSPFIDLGAATVTGVPVIGSTYGIPPALSNSPVTFGDTTPNEQRFYWTNRTIPGATSELGNRRLSMRHFKETQP